MHNNNFSRRGQEHFVSSVDETGLGAVDAVADESAPTSMWGEAWTYLRRRPLFWVSVALIFLALLMAIVPQLFTSTDPQFCELGKSLAKPAPGHPFGFDRQGCDIYSRMIYGARASVAVGVLAAIVVMQMFKESRSIITVVVVLALFGWTNIARITRGAVLSTKNEEFVTAARAVGASKWRILTTHVLPNSAAPIIVYATVALGTFIVAEATLSFLGIGLPPSIVSWGGDIAKAQASLRTQPMVLFYPAVALGLTVLSFIMMGDAVRDALDPKSRKR
ncbi:ABC transporter permease [Corynebacterium diphtheriae]|uniref:ABC transporter permease n=1 Tax=Corynebacterium diphtheriae TaxID=1717 RepID=UPI000A1DACF9|nr:ABC transporter permease [Corynebacterium diphtheriae]OSQ27549.1 peptide ABC transporter permease [Corynebacterium diphtheriae]CAB0592413.1 ABC transporter permease [Corynebacterium diphtheriae]